MSELEQFIQRMSEPEWVEGARIGMGVMRCFEDLSDEVIECEAFINALEAKYDQFVHHAFENPCCKDTSKAHILGIAGRSAMLWAFVAGARSGNINVEGLSHDPIPAVTDAEIEEAKAKYIEQNKEELDSARDRVNKTIAEMGLQQVEKDGVVGVVIDESRLGELLNRLRGVPEAKEEEPPPGMYL